MLSTNTNSLDGYKRAAKNAGTRAKKERAASQKKTRRGGKRYAGGKGGNGDSFLRQAGENCEGPGSLYGKQNLKGRCLQPPGQRTITKKGGRKRPFGKRLRQASFLGLPEVTWYQIQGKRSGQCKTAKDSNVPGNAKTWIAKIQGGSDQPKPEEGPGKNQAFLGSDDLRKPSAMRAERRLVTRCLAKIMGKVPFQRKCRQQELIPPIRKGGSAKGEAT